MKQWEDSAGCLCPRCQQETLRLIAGICPKCYKELPAILAKKLRGSGFWVNITDSSLDVRMPYTDYGVKIHFTRQGILYYEGGRNPVRLLFRSLEPVIEAWAREQQIPLIFDRRLRRPA